MLYIINLYYTICVTENVHLFIECIQFMLGSYRKHIIICTKDLYKNLELVLK